MDLRDVRNSLIVFGSRNSIILLKVSGLLLFIWLQVTSLGCGMQQQRPPPTPTVRDPRLVPNAVLIVSKVYFVDTGSDFEKEEKIWPSVQGERGLIFIWGLYHQCCWARAKGQPYRLLGCPLV